MGVVTRAVDGANVVQLQALVYTLLGVFDATRDLFETLKIKEKRDYELSLRAKGYPVSRRVEYVEDEVVGKDEDLVMDKAAVTRQFELGFQKIGSQFAVGDALSHVALQAQIIALQNVLVMTFLYGPTSSDPISYQLSNLCAASRSAGTCSVDILAAQIDRQQALVSCTPPSSRSPVAPWHDARATQDSNTSHVSSASTCTSLVARHTDPPIRPRSGSPANTTVLDTWRSRPHPDRTDTTDTTWTTGPTCHGDTKSARHELYCPYAIELQQHRDLALSASLTRNSAAYCPHCKRTMPLSPGKAWEIIVDDDDNDERFFHVSNRFVVKCHRDGADGQYTCLLCSRHAPCVETVCGDVKALIKHICDDHGVAELKLEEDITEVVRLVRHRQRDSGVGRRGAGLGPTMQTLGTTEMSGY
ncbi:hypothetical protein ACEQ8H_002613 [Pleosporales sp. CAS-2024a]